MDTSAADRLKAKYNVRQQRDARNKLVEGQNSALRKLREAFEVKKVEIKTRHSYAVSERDDQHKNKMKAIMDKRNALDQSIFDEIANVQANKYNHATQQTEELRNASSERKKEEMAVLTKFNAAAAASITALEQVVDANDKAHGAQHDTLQEEVDTHRTAAQQATKDVTDVRAVVTAHERSVGLDLSEMREQAKANKKDVGGLNAHILKQTQRQDRFRASMAAALQDFRRRRLAEVPNSVHLTAAGQSHRLNANYNDLGPAEQCLARRRLARRPQTHTRVLEALLEEIKRSG